MGTRSGSGTPEQPETVDLVDPSAPPDVRGDGDRCGRIIGVLVAVAVLIAGGIAMAVAASTTTARTPRQSTPSPPT